MFLFLQYQYVKPCVGEPNEGMKVHLMGGPKAPSMVYREKAGSPTANEGVVHTTRSRAQDTLGASAVA